MLYMPACLQLRPRSTLGYTRHLQTPPPERGRVPPARPVNVDEALNMDGSREVVSVDEALNVPGSCEQVSCWHRYSSRTDVDEP